MNIGRMSSRVSRQLKAVILGSNPSLRSLEIIQPLRGLRDKVIRFLVICGDVVVRIHKFLGIAEVQLSIVLVQIQSRMKTNSIGN